MKKIIFYIFTVAVVLIAIQSCKTYYFRFNYKDANRFIHETNNLHTKPFLKAHLKNGDVVILEDSWEVDTTLNIVSGKGTQYDFNRKQMLQDSISIYIDSVALFETNAKILNPESGRITALSIMTGLDVAMGIFCLTNPKACFGSCPTFYINENDNFHYADAEGFSNAILPSMEYYDIDAINPKTIAGNDFSITMKNEALETHCVRDVKILAYPLETGERVYQSPGNDFYLCKNNYSLTSSQADEGDITALLKNQDQQERFSLADGNNLNSREDIYLTFDNVKNIDNIGFILNFRQTLMTTYLFYSAMGYMGDEVSDVFVMLETDEDMRDKFDATTKLLGGIDVYTWNEHNSSWEYQDSFYETGPIAINKQFIPLQNLQTDSEVKIKLVLNRGLWRIDYVALTNMESKVDPIELSPSSVLNNGKPDSRALNEITSPDKYLISMPGSAYKFNFIMPEANREYELFLYSKGYYLEWMRDNWLKEKDLLKLKQMVFNPERYLRGEAKEFKRYESTMEQQFWNSKIDAEILSNYEPSHDNNY